MTYFDTTLNDKYNLDKTHIYLSGTQALIRLCLEQTKRDREKNLNTAGYVTGYRGSPLGGVDTQFWRAEKYLKDASVVFEAGLNEDLAATAVWGTQQAELKGDGKYDGVFSMWYGKGPGVDRSGDAIRHANLSGTSPNGGVLMLMGDDHTCESSTTAHQSEYALVDAMVPILNPASISEIIEYGLHGWALSRYSGVWCGLKCVKDNIESSGTINFKTEQIVTKTPTGFDMPVGGLNIRQNDHPTAQEARLHKHKLEAVRAYVKTNQLNKTVYTGGNKPKIGIVSSGKSFLDVLQALEELGIDETRANDIGIRLYKVAMPWPLEPTGILKFASGLDQIIVVEEKRGLIERQVKEFLFDAKLQPSVIGKKDENGDILFQPELALKPAQIALGIGERIAAITNTKELANKLPILHGKLSKQLKELPVNRGPVFCAGCPHNSSTKLPNGARGFAGIGCHWIAQLLDQGVEGYTHMGGEGANWIGEGKFSKCEHVFQNIGDGTFNHSGILAIRAAIASNVNITYKILYNDAVAMTGGQTNDGGIDVYDIAHQVSAAGVKEIAFVTEDPSRIDARLLPSGIKVQHRSELLEIQKHMQTIKGVSALIYDQTCATEKRRRRKRGTMPDLDKRLFIHPEICENCGDCTEKSNCVAVQPVDTPLGRKRKIDQSVCNKDFSCADGFCPSFVIIKGGELKKQRANFSNLPSLTKPKNKVELKDNPYAILVTGVGGTGVVTIGALIGMAAHIEGLGCGSIDMAGLAQKGGSVYSHIKLAKNPNNIKAIRVADETADLVLGCDVVTSAGNATLSAMSGKTKALINTHEQMPREYTTNRDFKLPSDMMHSRILDTVGSRNIQLVNATEYATRLLGDNIGSNLFILGVAYQNGLIPLSEIAILKAIKLNNVAVEMNKMAFALGRHWAIDPGRLDSFFNTSEKNNQPDDIETIVADRAQKLTQYQDKKYAKSYQDFLAKISDKTLAKTVAINLYKLMAYKDEYEIARLYSDPSFKKQLSLQFQGEYKIKLSLAPPLLSLFNSKPNQLRKYEFGSWVFPIFSLLKSLKFLRGTLFDPFGFTYDRKLERNLISDYKALILKIISESHDQETMLAIANLPQDIRGYGEVKLKSVRQVNEKQEKLVTQLNQKKDQAA